MPSGSSSSEDGEDLHLLSSEEFLAEAGVEDLIDAVQKAIDTVQPPVADLVGFVVQLVELGADEAYAVADAAGAERCGRVSSSGGILPAEGAFSLPASAPEVAYFEAVEAALVGAVRELAEERPFLDDVPCFLANRFRVAASRLPAVPASPPPAVTTPASSSSSSGTCFNRCYLTVTLACRSSIRCPTQGNHRWLWLMSPRSTTR